MIEYFTPLTLGDQHQGVLSDEDVTEVWATVKSEVIIQARNLKDGVRGAEALNPDEKEVEKTLYVR